jgi:hypothetical protein
LRRPVETGLHAAIGMVEQVARRRAVPLQRHDEGIEAQLGAEVVGHRPAQDLARGQVLDRGEIQPALVCGQVADVGQPDLVGPLGGEVARQPVGGDRELVAAVRRARRAALPLAAGLSAISCWTE